MLYVTLWNEMSFRVFEEAKKKSKAGTEHALLILRRLFNILPFSALNLVHLGQSTPSPAMWRFLLTIGKRVGPCTHFRTKLPPSIIPRHFLQPARHMHRRNSGRHGGEGSVLYVSCDTINVRRLVQFTVVLLHRMMAAAGVCTVLNDPTLTHI